MKEITGYAMIHKDVIFIRSVSLGVKGISVFKTKAGANRWVNNFNRGTEGIVIKKVKLKFID